MPVSTARCTFTRVLPACAAYCAASSKFDTAGMNPRRTIAACSAGSVPLSNVIGVCRPSAQTAGALRALKADYCHVNIFEEPELREALKAFSSWPTYPQLYVKGELVGGCDIVTEMYRSGELKTLLQDAGAIA